MNVTSIFKLIKTLLPQTPSAIASGEQYLSQAADRQDLALRIRALDSLAPALAASPAMAAGVR